jgi:hypothetical protein
MVERRGAYRLLVGNLREMSPLGRPVQRREDNTKMGLQDVGSGGGGVVMECIDLTWDRDKWQASVNVIMNIRVS